MGFPTLFHRFIYLGRLIIIIFFDNIMPSTFSCHTCLSTIYSPLPPTLDCAVLSPVLQWYDLDSPESTLPPGGMSEEASPFHRLMLMRCFRVDRVYQAVTNYIASTMGEFFITPPFIRWVPILNCFQYL